MIRKSVLDTLVNEKYLAKYEGEVIKIKSEWWDKLGNPKYGGEMVLRIDRNPSNFDPYYEATLPQIFWAWMESLAKDDWTLDPSAVGYKLLFQHNSYRKGYLAESWEFPDPSTFVVHLRKGIRWQDIPPANGREFTADDVAYHFHRLWGLNSDLIPSPDHSRVPAYKNLISVTAIDRSTVVFQWKAPNPELIMMSLLAPNPSQVFEAHEAVEEWGDLSDWRHAIGTGPFVLKDFIPNRSATLVKNPNYWGYDERHTQNKLPYADTVKLLIIPDNNEALSLMRAGKIDLITPVSFQDAKSIRETNPEILQFPIPFPAAVSLDPRIDRAPFSDIRVRKAMQLAIDLPTVAKDYYHGDVEPYPTALSSRNMEKGGFPYEEWPPDLKEEYTYNPKSAKKLLADAGYPNGFKTNIVADTAVDLNLLQIVKSYFAEICIDLEIRPMDSSSWNDFVLYRHEHDQLAQRLMPSFGYEYEPIRLLHGLQTGHPTYQMISDPVCDTLYPKALAANSLDEALSIYRYANEYFARQHFIISLLQPQTYALCQPWLKGFSAQFGSLTGATVLSFYLSRFWIDQDLKKSMGHQVSAQNIS